MILGASHITLGCGHLDEGAASLSKCGYRVDFVERHLSNDRSKARILESDCDVHGIGLLRSDAGFPIELVSYRAKLPSQYGRYIGVFNCRDTQGSSKGLVDQVSSLPAASFATWKDGILEGLAAPALFTTEPYEGCGLKKLLLPVSDLRLARNLWCNALGFRLIEEDENSLELKFVSPVRSWELELALFKSPPTKSKPVLDAQGMACLSMITSNIDRDVGLVVAGGAHIMTDIFSMRINGRQMKIAILADHDGAFIELLEVVR